MAPKRSSRTITAARVLLTAGAGGALWFAIFAGEYSTVDLVRQRRRQEQLVALTDSLQLVVDSLKRYRLAIQTDPAVQERIAREEFGMVRGSRELLYRFAEPDSAPGEDSAGKSP